MPKTTKTDRILKNMKRQKFEPKTPIAEDMFLPNHSGIASHPEAKNNFLKLNTSNGPLTGDLEISKATPEIKLTDTGDSNSARMNRTDTNAEFSILNTAEKQGGTTLGNALDFDGSNDYVDCGSDSSLDITGDLTITLWLKPTSIATNQTFISKGDFDTGVGIGYLIQSLAGSGDLRFNSRAGAGDGVTFTNLELIPNQWNFVAIVYTSSTRTAKAFLGSETQSGTIDTALPSKAAEELWLGARMTSGSPEQTYPGLIDEVGVWSKTLSDNDIADVYNSGTGLFLDKDNNFPTDAGSIGTNLEALWHLDETTGTSAADSSDNTNTGTLTNMTNDDWVEGIIPKETIPAADTETKLISHKDGVDDLEAYILTMGDATNPGRYVAEGQTLRWNIEGSEKMQMDNDGAIFFTNNGGLNFGEIFVKDNGTDTTFGGTGVANKSQITIFANDGESNGDVTPDHTNDHITIGKAGKYLITLSISATTDAGGSDEYGFSLWKNNGTTEFTNVHSHRVFGGGAGDKGSISLSGIIDAAANDTLEVWAWNEDNTEAILIDDITLSAVMIGA